MHTVPSSLSVRERFVRYLDEADRYGVSWWSLDRDPQRSRLARVPGLAQTLDARARAGDLIETRSVYRDSAGWDEERCRLHRELLDGAIETRGEAESDPPAIEGSIAFLTLGLPGSGKTRVLRRILAAHLHAHGHDEPLLPCDPDDLRVRFPEYESGLGSEIVQEELVRLVYGDPDDPLGDAEPCLQDRVLQADGRTVRVIDTIGSEEHTPPIVADLSRHGFEVHVLVTWLPVDDALQRAMERALESGRFVHPEIIEAAEGRPERALAACRETGGVSAYAVVDTSGPADEPPRIRVTDERRTYGAVSEQARYW